LKTSAPRYGANGKVVEKEATTNLRYSETQVQALPLQNERYSDSREMAVQTCPYMGIHHDTDAIYVGNLSIIK